MEGWRRRRRRRWGGEIQSRPHEERAWDTRAGISRREGGGCAAAAAAAETVESHTCIERSGGHS